MSSARRSGLVWAICSALLFGASAPLAKRLLSEVSPIWLAALLYLGAGLGLALVRAIWPLPAEREAPLRRRDLPTVAGIVAFGGVLGPLLLLFGLRRLSALAGSLLLNLEAPLTIAVAVVVFHEHLSRREALAVFIVLGSAFLLALAPGSLTATPVGCAAVGGASFAWAIDNNLTGRLSGRDPVAITRVKTLCAGIVNLAIGFAAGAPSPPWRAAGAAMLLGLGSYGLSVVLAIRAMRLIGTARQAAIFATAPFAGGLLAVLLLRDQPTRSVLAAAALMAVGIATLVRAKHRHVHTHEALDHEHAHYHDEHHQHTHEGPTSEPHSHRHRHDPITHEHEHTSDAHHRHRHAGDKPG
jgi:drug/metabolite transporter (DMT)-like permease